MELTKRQLSPPLVILFRIFFVSSAFASTNETDKLALLSLKGLVKDDPLDVLSSWNHSLNFCSWRRVSCSSKHQRVTELDLSTLNLAGSLSPHIGNLTFLRVIDLSNNIFNGQIPQEISQLYRLEYLLLQNNSFQGDLPLNLSRCLALKVVNLNQNALSGTIPSELGSLSNLQQLVLGTNSFTGQIPMSLGNLSSLRTFDLNSNKIFGSIPSTLSLLSNLEYFNLGDNLLSGVVPSKLYNITSIQVFGVHLNKLEGTLPQDLSFNLPKLNLFLLETNKFSGHIPSSIANSSGLVQFIIGENSFTGPLSINFGSFLSLQKLGLYGNDFGSSAPLNYLSFLVKSLTNCTKLGYFDTERNGFSGELPYSIVNLSTTLFWMNLGANNLSGSIPDEIGKLVNLQRLIMFKNLLTGPVPESIGKLQKLDFLMLAQNKISGEIPTSIVNMTQLTLLSFENNMLKGSIPVFANQFVLQTLYLSHNQLTGILPSRIGNLINLIDLVISGNKFTGEIPSSLGNSLMLEFLRMDDNHFDGVIPSSFRKLKSLQILDLSQNNLSGRIPSFLGELPFITLLNLSNNVFDGEVPTEGVFKNISMFSIVDNMHLCGGIAALQLPKCATIDPKKKKRYITFVIIFPTLFMLVSLAMIFYLVKRTKIKNVVMCMSLEDEQFPKLSYGELVHATNGFSKTNLIGQGKYGSVYKGILSSTHQVVAIKVINLEIPGGKTSFLAECEILRNIRHRNLVKIITCCSSIDYQGAHFKALVLAFMPNGSLDNWLHPSPSEQERGKHLTLLQRLSIAIDVASALEYIHHHCKPGLIHCDIKPGNVLLDEEFGAHVSDFGLARFILDKTTSTSSSGASSISIRGTTGYIPPEYGMSVEVSLQGDVYSYGILILEMFTGKRPTDDRFMDNLSLRDYVNVALLENVMEVVDPRIVMESENMSTTRNNSNVEGCLTSILRIGVLCCSKKSMDRMDIKDVIAGLTAINNVLLGVSGLSG